MNLLLDPNVAYVMLVGGLVVAILALFSPGTGLLEIGALFILVLAGYSIANLAINWWALVLLLVGVVPFILAVRKSRQWIFLALALAFLVIGSVFLFRDEQGRPVINLVLALFVSLVAVGMLWIIGRKSLEAIGTPPSHDLNRLVGMIGEARTAIHHEGSVHVGGEDWSARSEVPIPAHAPVRVVGREGLVLLIEPLPEKHQTGS
jgi:membrane-bound ClpP family serine protease